MTSPQSIDPLNDGRVKKIESIYIKFLDTLDTLNKEQQQIITQAMLELNRKQIEAVRTQLNNQTTYGR
ncbi:MAG: hypothetical protein AAB558_04180 [Patescibacteria group bacterium]